MVIKNRDNKSSEKTRNNEIEGHRRLGLRPLWKFLKGNFFACKRGAASGGVGICWAKEVQTWTLPAMLGVYGRQFKFSLEQLWRAWRICQSWRKAVEWMVELKRPRRVCFSNAIATFPSADASLLSYLPACSLISPSHKQSIWPILPGRVGIQIHIGLPQTCQGAKGTIPDVLLQLRPSD